VSITDPSGFALRMTGRTHYDFLGRAMGAASVPVIFKE